MSAPAAVKPLGFLDRISRAIAGHGQAPDVYTSRMLLVLLLLLTPAPLRALSLEALVLPATVVSHDGKPVSFALYGVIEFKTVSELFPYIDAQAGRWQFPTETARQEFADNLLRRGIESRVVSMVDEKPLEVLITHTRAELDAAIAGLPAVVFRGNHWHVERAAYRDTFARVQARWKTSLNCWSAAPSIPVRVLSNWYVIDEGIELFGAKYDSTEHFWQAVKYHPGVTAADLLALLDRLDAVDWRAWFDRVDHDQKLYLGNAYAIEFLRHNLTAERREQFRRQLLSQPRQAIARELQQRSTAGVRFTPFDEKTFWGDLADVFHLLYHFRHPSLSTALAQRHFDGVYLHGKTLGFVSPEFQRIMLEIWRVKFIQISRFNEVIRSIPSGVKLDHFLNDGDSPDIPIPVYIRYLEQIREEAAKRPAPANGNN